MTDTSDVPAAPAPADLAQRRAELLRRHAEARHRRDTAALDSPAYRAAAEDIADIEVRISGLDVVASGGPAAEPAKGATVEATHH